MGASWGVRSTFPRRSRGGGSEGAPSASAGSLRSNRPLEPEAATSEPSGDATSTETGEWNCFQDNLLLLRSACCGPPAMSSAEERATRTAPPSSWPSSWSPLALWS